jgi:hypothetical protein
MKLAVCLAALSVAAFTSALADDPQTPAAQPAAAQSAAPEAPAVPAAPAAADKPATTASNTAPAKADKSEIVDAAATDALIKTMRARGYKPVNRKGTLVFCRPEGELGTHFQKERCSTLDQLKDAERTGKDFVNQLQQQGSPNQFKGDMPPNMHP